MIDPLRDTMLPFFQVIPMLRRHGLASSEWRATRKLLLL
jgi:hypothetical protein